MSKQAMQMALEALQSCTYDEDGYCLIPDNEDAITALRAALDAPYVKESSIVHKSADDYLRYKYGAYRGHFAWRELEEAYSQGRCDESVAQGPHPWPDGKLSDARIDEIMKPLTQNVPYSWREFARMIEQEVRGK